MEIPRTAVVVQVSVPQVLIQVLTIVINQSVSAAHGTYRRGQAQGASRCGLTQGTIGVDRWSRRWAAPHYDKLLWRHHPRYLWWRYHLHRRSTLGDGHRHLWVRGHGHCRLWG